MSEASTGIGDPEQYWDAAYQGLGTNGVSWFQPDPQVSLSLIEALGVSIEDSIVDVGGGASLLVDRLFARGQRDVTVLDISSAALNATRARLPTDSPVIRFHQDLLAWCPTRRYGLWHDRAVFHFLIDGADRESYFDVLHRAVEPGGAVILATFAQNGPEYCSGLPVARYSAEDLASLLKRLDFEVVESKQEDHKTPSGAIQPFIWIAARANR